VVSVYKIASLLTALLFLAPPIGAESPDHPDDDGDLASGPVGIDGVSTDSDGRTFRFDLHIDAFHPDQPDTRYWFDLDADGRTLHWECLVRGIRQILSLTCDLVEQGTQFLDAAKDVGPLGDAVQANRVEVEHHVSLTTSTIGFTATYDDLGLEHGDTVTLREGSASYEERPRRLDVPLDVIVVEQDVVVR